MKKYMIPAIALVMIAGMANAQVQKKPASANTATVAKTTAPKNNSLAQTASVTPKNSQAKTAAPAIKRKHHHKKGKTTKVENK